MCTPGMSSGAGSLTRSAVYVLGGTSWCGSMTWDGLPRSYTAVSVCPTRKSVQVLDKGALEKDRRTQLEDDRIASPLDDPT